MMLIDEEHYFIAVHSAIQIKIKTPFPAPPCDLP